MSHIRTFNKLVRNNIPRIITGNGEFAVTRTLNDDEEYFDALCEKLKEEVGEFATERSAEEFADVMEVITALFMLRFEDSGISKIRQEKNRTNGDFSDRVFLEYSYTE